MSRKQISQDKYEGVHMINKIKLFLKDYSVSMNLLGA